MSSDLEWVALGEMIEYQKGYAFSSGEYSDTGCPIVRVSDFTADSINHQTEKAISPSLAQTYSRFALEEGDIVIATVGSWGTNPNSVVGKTIRVPKEVDGSLLNQNAVRIRARNKKSQDFLFYSLKDKSFSDYIVACAQGSANQASITLSDIFRYEIAGFSPDEHRARAAILRSIDDKIELNRKTNETLEAMAKALFKSWFVDFDPVRAKAAGCPTGLPAEISDLFSDSFEDSELGEIPSGWRVGSIYEVSSVIYGAPFSSSLFNSNGEGVPVVRIRDLPTEAPAVFTTEIHPKGTLIKPGDIVVGMDGEFRGYLWGGNECWMNQRVCQFVPKTNDHSCFVMESIRKPLMEVEMSETATTVIHLGKGDIDRFKIVIPNQAILDLFGVKSKPLLDTIVRNKKESRSLTQLRDALLPKLISGEIRIPAAERMLEEVGV